MTWFAGFATATAFFTRVPVAPRGTGGTLAEAAWAFPLVGAGIGAVAALAFVLAQGLGLGDAVAALLAVLAGIAISGGLHEDGLADTADGFGGGRDRAAKLDIMRDSRIGTYGVLALLFSIGLRAAALVRIGDPIAVALALVAAHAASRGLLPAAMTLLAPAREDGLGAGAGRPRALTAAMAAAIGVTITLAALLPAAGAITVAVAAAVMLMAAALARRQIGGYTGDVLGAFQQVGEIAMLLAAAATR
jgi:adenosylcobinamide-GDP ribazoletransferase